MAHIAILTIPQAGHLYPTGGVGAELQRRGHTVTVCAYERARELVERLGLAFCPMPNPPKQPGLIARMERIAAWAVKQGLGVQIGAEIAFRSAWLLEHVPAVLRDLRVDAIVADQHPWISGAVADKLDVPYVTVFSALMYHQEPLIPPTFTSWALPTSRWGRWRNQIGHLGQNWGVGPVIRSVNRDLARRGRPRITRVRDLFSPYAQLTPLVAELDFPWTDLPPQLHYLGPLGAARSEAAIEFPWERLDGRPLVYASLGTIKSSKNARVYRRIAAACADLDVQLVMALGKWSASRGQARDGLGELAGQPIIVEFAPQLALLQRAAAFITHAGQNSVLEGLGQGVPLLCLPRSDDQPGMAARVVHVGAGLKASFARSEPAELRGLLQRVLTEETFREQARRIQTAIAGSGGPRRAADIFEQVLTQRQPVLRSA